VLKMANFALVFETAFKKEHHTNIEEMRLRIIFQILIDLRSGSYKFYVKEFLYSILPVLPCTISSALIYIIVAKIEKIQLLLFPVFFT
jgi:hypothetical protein